MFKNLHRLSLFIITLCITVNFFLSGETSAANDNELKNRIIIDCIGREVKIPQEVEKIGCLFAFSSHTVGMLGRGNDIVAIVEGLKRDVLFTDMYPNIQNALVPSISSNLNIEELARSNCDLLFIKDENALNEGYVAQVKKLNIPYLVVAFRSIKEQQYAIDAKKSKTQKSSEG